MPDVTSAYCPTCKEVTLCAVAIEPKQSKKKKGQAKLVAIVPKLLCTVCGTIFNAKIYV